ncbi:MAG TPA: CHY zinc finger protein [Pyrinomonadaceae bacterium]|nr:CHY zinc finger protein [Pyrinomonadaceae bacterium]
MLIHNVEIKGANVDNQTRCDHYHKDFDIIAIKFKCCGDWFSCFECHAENTDHPAQVWKIEEFETKAILCGSCGYQLAIAEYLRSDSVCPRCKSLFNPGCAAHYHLYFETAK